MTNSVKISELDPFLLPVEPEDFLPLVDSSSLTTYRSTMDEMGNMISTNYTASFAVSASWASSSFSSSYSLSSSYTPQSDTASYALKSDTATSAAYATNAGTAVSAAYATEAAHAALADYATNSGHATTTDTVVSAAWADNSGHSDTSDYATNAGNATTADTATNAGHADTATNATHATNADTAISASWATNAGHALTADSLTSGPTPTPTTSPAYPYIKSFSFTAKNDDYINIFLRGGGSTAYSTNHTNEKANFPFSIGYSNSGNYILHSISYDETSGLYTSTYAKPGASNPPSPSYIACWPPSSHMLMCIDNINRAGGDAGSRYLYFAINSTVTLVIATSATGTVTQTYSTAPQNNENIVYPLVILANRGANSVNAIYDFEQLCDGVISFPFTLLNSVVA